MNPVLQDEVLTKHIALFSDNSSSVDIVSSQADSTRPTTYLNIDRISQPISYKDFFQNYLLQNKPCIFGSFVTEDWPSRKDWVKDGGGYPDFEFLHSHFGDVTVPVANCEKVRYDAQPKEDMKLTDYLKYWQEHIKQDYESERGCLYMKDMHFTRDCFFYKAYTTPVFFSSDWLNEFWDTRTDCGRDDYRFLYMGPKGSWTPFHADVFRSFSWSANICGKKRWILVPPGQEEHLRDHLGNLPYDVTSCDVTHSSNDHQEKHYTPVEVIQSAGEVIFVPSGWHHQVYNLDDTISVNHNWFNGTSISRAFVFLQNELTKVEKSIDDCRDMDGWEQQCQLILKASSGMDYQEFFQLLVSVSRRRLKVVTDCLDKLINLSSSAAANVVQYQTNTYVNRINETMSCDQSGDKLSREDSDERSTNKATLHSNVNMNIHGHLSHDNLAAKSSSENTESDTGNVQNAETDFKHWGRSLTFWHSVYDLRQVKRVLEEFTNDSNVKMLEIEHQELKPDDIQEEITHCMARVILQT